MWCCVMTDRHRISLGQVMLMAVGEGAGLGALGPRTVGEVEVKLFKEESPLCLSRIELSGQLDGHEVLVIRTDHDWFTATLEPMVPFL